MESASKKLYIFLENGWGNMLLELLAGYSIAEFMLPEKCKIIGLLTSEMMKTHITVYNNFHRQFGLPHPLEIDNILPKLTFESEQPKCDSVFLHEEYPAWIGKWKDGKLIMRADWMDINLEFIIPRLSNLQNHLACFRPSSIISDYLRDRYLSAISNQQAVGLHLRVRQPGDIMAHLKLPTAKWYADCLRRLESEKINEVFVISGISTGHLEAKEYLNELTEEIKSHFPILKITIIQDEPYYIDFFLLSSMSNIIITHSTFSVMAAILGTQWGLTKRVLVPSHAMKLNDKLLKLPKFEEVPGDEFVCTFRS